MRSSTSLALLLPVAASAAPVGNGIIDDLFCTLNQVVVGLLQQDAEATSYCASYLSYPTSTSTVTKTVTPTSVYTTVPVTVTADPVTDTITSTAAASTDVTITQTSTAVVTSTITQVTATETLTCLYSAYTAHPPTPTLLKRGYGEEYPKPTCIPPSWQPPAISNACSCLHIPTPCVTNTVTTTLAPGTITVTSTDTITPTDTITAIASTTEISTHTDIITTTSTTTRTVYAEATTVASNGVRYRKYEQPYNANLANSGYTSSYFKGKTPDWTGILTSLSFATPNWPSGSLDLTLQDHAAFPATQSALLLQGFFIAKETGTYTLSSAASSIDNWGYLWLGDVAYSAWSDANTAFKASRTGAGNVAGSTTVTLNAGDAIPLTWLWANGGGVARSYFAVTSPSGVTTTDTTGYFVQACSDTVFA